MEIKKIEQEISFNPEKMSKTNLFQSSHFFLDLYCLKPGQSQKPHAHGGNDKIYLIWKGEGKVSIGGKSSVCHQGEAILAPAGIDHGLENNSQGELIVLTFMAPHPNFK